VSVTWPASSSDGLWEMPPSLLFTWPSSGPGSRSPNGGCWLDSLLPQSSELLASPPEMLKAACPQCGYTIRLAKKGADFGGEE
jgi:hypothetical protein